MVLLLSGCTQKEDPQKYIKDLYSWDAEVRLVAGNALVGMGERAVPALIKELESPDPRVRYISVQILGRIKDPRAVPYLVSILKGPSKQMAAKAAEALGRIADEKALKPLIEAASDTSGLVRADAIFALGSYKGDQVYDIVVGALQDSVARVRARALAALSKYGKKVYGQVSPRIVDLASDPDPEVRYIAVQSLKWAGDRPEVIEALIKALDDPYQSVRLKAAISLSLLGDPKAIEPLEGLLARGTEKDKAAAKLALEKLRRRSSP